MSSPSPPIAASAMTTPPRPTAATSTSPAKPGSEQPTVSKATVQAAAKAQNPANVSLTGRGIIFAVIASAGLLADLGTKELIFRWRGLPGMEPAWRLIEAG